jgi:hypothetical protein
MFKDRAVVVTNLPHGHARRLADQASLASHCDDVCLRTTGDYLALFDLLVGDVDQARSFGNLVLLDDVGRLTRTGKMVQDYLCASEGRREFFAGDMYLFHIKGFPLQDEPVRPPAQSFGNAHLRVWRVDPSDPRCIPPPNDEGALYHTSNFTLANCGNWSLLAPKLSWRIDLEKHGGSDNRLAGMSRINLRAMCDDPSQMREALALHLFSKASVPSPCHTYAKLAFDVSYRGLFSVIEDIDRRFLKEHFGKNDCGNLYKASCCNSECATLEYQAPPEGIDRRRHYFTPLTADRTYRLKTNRRSFRANTYSDLARLIEAINGVALSGGPERFDTDGFRESMERIMNVRAFLRWAGVNVLLGAWDNYFATPSNYYLYNSGKRDGERDFVEQPYFTFIPWDYDNCLGIDNVGTRWQYSNLIDWPSSTDRYWNGHSLSRIPLVTNLLSNHAYRQYYIDHIEYLLDTEFNPQSIAAEIGHESDGGLWKRVCQSAYQESETPHGRPFTGRRYSNHEVYWNAKRQCEIQDGPRKIEGVVHYVRMRYDSARKQLEELRKTFTRSAYDAQFPSTIEPLPPVS